MLKNLFSKPMYLFVIVSTIVYSIVALLFSFDDKNQRYLLASDFSAYFTGAKIVRMGNIKRLYDLDFQQEVQDEIRGYSVGNVLPFRNPPLTAVFYSPLALLNAITAYRVYMLINLSVLFLGVAYLCKITQLSPKYYFLSLWYLPFMATIYNAQISGFLLLIYVFIYSAFKKSKYLFAGFLSGFLFLKFQHLMVLPFLLLISKDKRKFLWGSGASLFFHLVLSLFLYGNTFISDFSKFTFKSEAYDTGTLLTESYSLVSFAGFFQATEFANKAYLIAIVISGIIYMAMLVKMFNVTKKISLEKLFSSAVIFSLALNLHALYTDLVFLLIPLFFLAKQLERVPEKEHNVTGAFILGLYFLPWLGFFKLQGFVAIIFIIIGYWLLKTSIPSNYEKTYKCDIH